MPDIVKIAVVSPIFKGGDIKDPSNYRPISILPILLGKTIQFLVNNQLTQYLDDRGIIPQRILLPWSQSMECSSTKPKI